MANLEDLEIEGGNQDIIDRVRATDGCFYVYKEELPS